MSTPVLQMEILRPAGGRGGSWSNVNVNVNLTSNTGSASAITRARGSWLRCLTSRSNQNWKLKIELKLKLKLKLHKRNWLKLNLPMSIMRVVYKRGVHWKNSCPTSPSQSPCETNTSNLLFRHAILNWFAINCRIIFLLFKQCGLVSEH